MTNVVDIYRHVIDDVIKNVKADFAAEGVDDSTLHELQASWEFKLQQTGAMRVHASPPRRSAGFGASMPTGININLPYEPEEYVPTQHTQFQPAQTSSSGEPLVYQYQPQAAPSHYQLPAPSHYQPQAPSHYHQSMAQYRPQVQADSYRPQPQADVYRTVKPEPYMDPPSSWHRTVGLDVNIAYDADKERADVPVTRELLGSKRKRDDLLPSQSGIPIPQHDGAFDNKHASAGYRPKAGSIRAAWLQTDGGADGYHDAVDEEDYNEVAEEEPGAQASTPAPNGVEETQDQVEDVAADDVEPPLGEDDDDGLEDVNDGEQEPETNNLVLAQFDKVTRSKNKWKCTLKDGIMHLNGRDTLFTKATGEFEW
eukprot:TRINITY_DN20855_c0_g1_i1.p1 TRINITY_DN20855_c0_g1~~TRINITY_DN20855_c0_g1_i1.p1  ORF type:complete len:368 (+),score=84.76 TRINITY_DN20855_c0_g1_i1:412-1515(+)